MSHQIKINLSNESSASATLQPIIISWTNPSTDNQSQMIDETRIKQEDELQIISQVIQEVPHPATKKTAEIISPTRVLRSHGKVDKSPVIVNQKNTKISPKSRSNSKIANETENVEVFTKTIDISTKKSSSNGETSPWTTTVQTKRPTKSQALNKKLQDIESNSNTKSSKKIISKSDEPQKPEPKRRFTSKTVMEVIQEPKDSLKIDDKNTKSKQLKKDKNGNSLKITNKLSKTPTTTNKRKSCSPFEASSDPTFNNEYIKKEMELDIAPEVDTGSESAEGSALSVKDSTKIVNDSIKLEPIDQNSGTSTVINPKKLQSFDKSSLSPQNITESSLSVVKDECIEEVTIKVTDIKPNTDVKQEPVENSSQNGSSFSETNSSPLKYFNLSSSSKIYELGLNDQYKNKFIPITKSSSNSLDITVSNDQIPEDSNKLDNKSPAREPEAPKYEDDDDDDDDDEDRLIIKEEEDDIETIDISDSDDEKPGNLTPKKFQNSWNNLTSQSLINGDSDSLTSSNHVSISYPSIDGSTSLQPPVIQISYQFPMDSQHSASSTQIQKHFSSSKLESSSQMYKNLGQQSTFGQLFSENHQQSSLKYNFGQNLDKSKLSSKNMIVYPSTSQVGTNNQQTSQKRRHSALMTQNSSTIPQSSSKSLEHQSKKQKVTSDQHQIPIIPYNPSTIPPRRISSTSSDGSSSTSHPFQCKMCMAIFKRKIDMIHHLKSHSEAKFECQRCGMKFKFEGYFSKHECIACEICNKTFVLKQQLRNHQRNEHDIQMAMYECDLCDKKLRYRHGVLYHMSKTHMLYLEDKYACDVCGKRFKLKESIRLHIKNHESVIECNLCDKKVKRINLNVHMKSVHATERNFKCRICRTTFKTKECLKSHMRTHEKSFECTECGKRFSNKSHLKEHMEWHKNPEAYKCKICQKSFSQKYCLKAHVKLHESGHLFTKFKCSSCPYSTDKPDNFEKHELKHKRQEENEEMRKNWLQCEKCPVKLKNKLKLATHYWKKHSEVMPK